MMAIDLNELATAIGQLVIRFRVRRWLKAQWQSKNEVLLSAEFGLESDTRRLKIGDGATAWNSLPYLDSGSDLGLTSDNAGLGISITIETVGGTSGSGGNPGDDAYWSDVSVLLPFDGTVGDVVTFDYGPLGLEITNAGNSVLNATHLKFGSTTSFLPNSYPQGWLVEDDASLNFGSGDWTIEGWFFTPIADTTTRQLWGKWHYNTSSIPQGIYLAHNSSGLMNLWITDSTGASTSHNFAYPSTGAINWGDGAWHYMMCYRSGTDVHLWIDGYEWTTSSTTGVIAPAAIGSISILTTTDTFDVGFGKEPATAQSFVGWISDFRVTKGVARTHAIPTAKHPAYAVPITPGVDVLKITNTGIRSLVAGDNIDIDDTDPYNPVISSTGGGSGPSYPLPNGAIMWFDSSVRAGVNGKPVYFLAAPMSYPGSGVIAAASGTPTFAADGSIASGGKFTVSPTALLTDCTILAVIKTPAALSSGSSSTISSGSASGALQFRVTNSSGTIAIQLVKSSVAAIGDDVSSGSLALSTKMLVGATMSGTAWTLRRGGSQTTSGTSANVPTSGNNAIGTNSSGGEDATHQLYELIIFDRVLSSGDMTTAENYLKTKYGL